MAIFKKTGKKQYNVFGFNIALYSRGQSARQRANTRQSSDLTGADAKKYVESHADLTAAYNKIKMTPHRQRPNTGPSGWAVTHQ